jgi:hypothetical protein
MLSFFDLHYTPFVHLSPFAFNSLYFLISRIKPNRNWLPSLARSPCFLWPWLRCITDMRVRWLMELSSANHAHSSHQARGDLTWMNQVPPRSYAGGNKKKVSLSDERSSNTPTSNKNKLVDFAVVSGWTALAGRWCLASLACFSTELQVYLNGQWRELFELQVMMRHGLVAPLLRRNNVFGNTHWKWTTLLQYFLYG